jgi:hypothetical protein
MMQTTPLFPALIAILATIAFAAEPGVQTFWFQKEDAGQVPPGWDVAHTGKGEISIWKVVADSTAHSGTGYVVAQTAQFPNASFNLCVLRDIQGTDVDPGVRFKAVAGKNDQGGGLDWRYRDADNYYLARMYPVEDNYRVYKAAACRRIQLGTREGLKVPAGEWHALRVQQKGDHIRCFLDGKEYLTVQDTTFPTAGRIGS